MKATFFPYLCPRCIFKWLIMHVWIHTNMSSAKTHLRLQAQYKRYFNLTYNQSACEMRFGANFYIWVQLLYLLCVYIWNETLVHPEEMLNLGDYPPHPTQRRKATRPVKSGQLFFAKKQMNWQLAYFAHRLYVPKVLMSSFGPQSWSFRTGTSQRCMHCLCVMQGCSQDLLCYVPKGFY